MSARKKNARASNKKQIPINSYFSVKPKASVVSSPPKRLAQSSLAVHPARSKKVSEDDDVLDLTKSTSPTRDESPPSSKKRRTSAGPTPTDRVTRQSARHTLFDKDMSPLTTNSSPAPSSHSSRPTTPAKQDREPKQAAVSPSPAHIRHRDSMMIDDPNDIVESSQTQYIHLQFTPPSQRTRVSDIQRVHAPTVTPPTNRPGAFINRLTSANRAAFDESITPTPEPYDWHIPSSQGEVSEPRTPRKRSWAAVDRSGTPSKDSTVSVGSAVASPSVAPGSQHSRSQMPPPILPASVTRDLVGSHPKRSTASEAGPLPRPLSGKQGAAGKAASSRLASLRAQPASAHPSSDDRPDHAAYPSVDTDLLTAIPSSNPASQEAVNVFAVKPNLPVPPVAQPDFTHPLHPQTPSRAHLSRREMTSSPSNLPSPRALMESIGLGSSSIPRPVLVPVSSRKPIEKRLLDPQLCSPKRPAPAPIQRPQDSPERGNTSSQTIIPSSQPIHDSSPPPDYDIDAEIHSFNQAQVQSQAYHLRSSQEDGSSQALPPSQSPIKNSRVDPNKSGVGMNGVFGMLGFGSEADSLAGSSKQTHVEQTDVHTPVTHNLPPSSPPPETPPHHHARIAEQESQFGTPGSMKFKGSPLVLAFERARARSRSKSVTTPVKLRAGPSSVSSPVVAQNPTLNLETQTQDESVVEDSQPKSQRRVSGTSKNKPYAWSQSAGARNAATGSARPKRKTRALRPTTPSQGTPLARHAEDLDLEIVDSSDVDEQAMELEARAPQLDIATSPVHGATTGKPILTPSKTPTRAAKGKGKETARIPSTPMRDEERRSSSSSPSPIRVAPEPAPATRYSSPSPLGDENTQTQDESETPWETLRPSQSVSQVLERRIVEEALVEAERVRVMRAERERERERQRLEEVKRKEQEQAEAARRENEAKEAELAAKRAAEEQRKTPAQVPSKATSMSPSQGGPCPTAVPANVSTPTTRRVMDKEIYIVTPTKIIKRTPMKTHRDRTASMTPSSPMEQDQGEDDEEYTYIDETFNPTESQRSFLNRIMNSSEAG